MNKKEQILKLVSELITEEQREWKEGDWIHYAGPVYDDKEYVAAIGSLLDKWFILGKKGSMFEKQFPQLLGKKYGILVNSGSSANLLAARVFTPGKVITPVSCFPTTLSPLLFFGYKPVFVDVELPNLNLNLDQVEDSLQKDPEIKYISFAHTLGIPPNMERIMKLVENYNVVFLEDACDALDSKWNGRLLGSFGEISTCSFYPAHHITMGEGGFVATNNVRQYNKLQKLRDWGRGCVCKGKNANLSPIGTCRNRFSNWLPEHPDIIIDHKYVFEEIGFNLKPLELQAAIGLEQIKKLPEFTKARQRNFQQMYNIFSKYEEHFHLPKTTLKMDPSYFSFLLTIKENAPFTRKQFIQYLETNKIQTRPHFTGNILYHPGYSHLLSKQEISRFTTANYTVVNSFFLGLSPIITTKQIDYIQSTVNRFMKEF